MYIVHCKCLYLICVPLLVNEIYVYIVISSVEVTDVAQLIAQPSEISFHCDTVVTLKK